LVKTEQLRDQAQKMPKTTMAEADATLIVWQQAEATLSAADAALSTGTAGDHLRQRVRDDRQQIEHGHKQAQRYAKLLRDLDDARMTERRWIDGHNDLAGAARAYAAAFTAYGFEVTLEGTDEVARQIRAEELVIRDTLIMALDEWRLCAHIGRNGRLAAQLRQIADAADGDMWRRQCRVAMLAKDGAKAIKLLSTEARGADLPPDTVVLLARTLRYRDQRQEATALLRWGRNRYPTAFWLHFELGHILPGVTDPSASVDCEEAIGCYRAALALRPDAGLVYTFLGNRLVSKNQLAEAIDAYHRAIQVAPKEYLAYYDLVIALLGTKRYDEALTVYHRAMEIEPNYAQGHIRVGLGLTGKKLFVDEAIAAFRRASAIGPRMPKAHYCLARLLKREDRLDEAIAEYQAELAIYPTYAACHYDLGLALIQKGCFAEAKTRFAEALRYFAPDNSLRPLALRQLENGDRLLSAEARLPDILAGKVTPADNRERLYLTEVCKLQCRYAAGASFWSGAVDDTTLADDLKDPYRFGAACCAALAAAGQGVDADHLSEPERAQLREQALIWLRAGLSRRSKLMAANSLEDRLAMGYMLQRWRHDLNVIDGRQAEVLKKMSAQEQEQWRMLWTKVTELLKKTDDGK
jgi:tetratricopeptide (TPR) repeat protein